MIPLRMSAWLQTASAPGMLVTASAVAQIVVAIALLVLVALIALFVFRLNRVVSELRRAAHQSFGPVSDRARSISDNVDFITQSVRSDVESLNDSVRGLSERLQLASDRMEERIEDFNALMTVVQGEAEEIFLDTASTVRGVREGARAIADPGSRAARKPSHDGSPATTPPSVPSSTSESPGVPEPPTTPDTEREDDG